MAAKDVCAICDEAVPLYVACKGRCKHKAEHCQECLVKYIREELNSKGDSLSVVCPFPSCKQKLDHSDVQSLCVTPKNKEVFARYDKLLLVQMLSKMPEFRWCKQQSCGSGQLHDSGDAQPIIRCFSCKAKNCFTCDLPWHAEISCADFQLSLADESSANAALLQRTTKRCPICNNAIEKNDGCNHMTCKKPGGCGHEFCWLCLASYATILTDGNHRHKPTCLYYAEYSGAD